MKFNAATTRASTQVEGPLKVVRVLGHHHRVVGLIDIVAWCGAPIVFTNGHLELIVVPATSIDKLS
jgi:hypothetical protein